MIPVVEGDYLVGIITFQNLMRKLTAISLRRPAAPPAPNAPAPQ
jgi:CBS domain-containing protein